MYRKTIVWLSIVVLLTALCAWSPWLTPSFAETRAVDAFNKAWQYVADGCGTNCKGCGAISSHRGPFGAFVTIEYACGMILADSPEYHLEVTAFISSFGSVHGIPKP